MQIAGVIPMIADTDMTFPPHTSSREQRRRQLALSIKRLSNVSAQHESAWTLFGNLLLASNELDHAFLGAEAKRSPRLPFAILKQEISRNLVSRRSIRMQGHICLCTGRRSWVEEWAEVSSAGFVVPQPLSDRHLRIDTIPVSEMKRVEFLAPESKPFDGFAFLVLHTVRREYTIFVKVIDERIAKDHIISQTKLQASGMPRLLLSLMNDVADVVAPCFTSPGNFTGSSRRVLNHFTNQFTANSTISTYSGNLFLKPLMPCRNDSLACELLRHAGSITKAHNNGNLSAADWRAFSKNTSMLQCLSLDNLSVLSLRCLFVNIYHTLLLHAFIVNGVPGNALAWKALKKCMCYEVGGYELSLQDIDEVIFGNYGNHFLMRDVISQTIIHNEMQTAMLTLEQNALSSAYHFLSEDVIDWRIGAVLQTGIGQAVIPVCVENTFEYQMRAVVTEVLQKHVVISPDLTTILLPRCVARICHNKDPENPRSWLGQLSEYLVGSAHERLSRVIHSNRMLHVSFVAPSYIFKMPSVVDIDWSTPCDNPPVSVEPETATGTEQGDSAIPMNEPIITPTFGIPNAWMSKNI